MRQAGIWLYDIVETAAGWVGLGFSERGLCWLEFPLPLREEATARIKRRAPGACAGRPSTFSAQIKAYFAGAPVTFSPEIDLSAGTPFQQQVWALVQSIPYGEVRSYGWLAGMLGKPSAARAVGAAVGANPVPIVVPCHRVVGADGRLVGFGGGLDLKRRLLALEGIAS